MKYLMTGACPIVLPDGVEIQPGHGEFDAELSPEQENFWVSSRAIAFAPPTDPRPVVAARKASKEKE